MSTKNVLTEYLAARFPEEQPVQFYRDLFPDGALARDKTEHDKFNGILVRLWSDQDKKDDRGKPLVHAERHFVMNELYSISTFSMMDPIMGGVTDLVSPVSYAGRRPTINMAHELFALVFDLDGIKVDDEGNPVGLIDLLHQMTPLKERRELLPKPTYIVSSGSGLHLYYMLDLPIRLWPNVLERLQQFRDAFTKRCWNGYVTDLSSKVQLESVVQSFRMVGSLSKTGDQVIRAFRTGCRVSMDYMNMFVPPSARVTKEIRAAQHTLEEARKLWPEWDPDWRKKALAPVSSPWRVKRALFDWWCRRVESGEPFEGNRYWCIFVAACYAAKCPEVSYEELESWAMNVRPMLDSMTKRKGNEFTEEIVMQALAAYGNPMSVKLRRDKVEEKTTLPMPVNKRNGRTREQHMVYLNGMNAVRRSMGENLGAGRPEKKDEIRQFALEHPEMNNSQIARELGVARGTVVKWLKGFDRNAVCDAIDSYFSNMDADGIMRIESADELDAMNRQMDVLDAAGDWAFDKFWERAAAERSRATGNHNPF